MLYFLSKKTVIPMEPQEEKDNAGAETNHPIVPANEDKISDDTNIDVANALILEHEKKSTHWYDHVRYFFHRLFSIMDDTATHAEIKERILSCAKFTGTNMVIMGCAIIIASIGLNTNSIAAIIGAMLISPLMNRILMMAYGTASADIHIFRKGTAGFILQVLISIIVSCLYFLASPIKEPTEQILARTNPTWYDVLIAIFGGIAGIIGQTRKGEYNNVIPGVAIATAIMPPLCVVGYALANSRWVMLGQAFYLFFINFYFIYFASVVVLNILAVPKVKEMTVKSWRKEKFRMARNTIIALIPLIIITTMMIIHHGDNNTGEEAIEASSEALASLGLM